MMQACRARANQQGERHLERDLAVVLEVRSAVDRGYPVPPELLEEGSRGRIERFSLDALVQLLARARVRVDLVVREGRKAKA